MDARRQSEAIASSGCSTRRPPTSRPRRGCGTPTRRSSATASAAGCWTFVADGAEALVARLREGGGADGVSTRNPVLTLIVSEYLHHDLVLQRAQIDIGFDEWGRWWLADPELRGPILGSALGRNATERAPAPAA
jgi:hypothetical protein